MFYLAPGGGPGGGSCAGSLRQKKSGQLCALARIEGKKLRECLQGRHPFSKDGVTRRPNPCDRGKKPKPEAYQRGSRGWRTESR